MRPVQEFEVAMERGRARSRGELELMALLDAEYAPPLTEP